MFFNEWYKKNIDSFGNKNTKEKMLEAHNYGFEEGTRMGKESVPAETLVMPKIADLKNKVAEENGFNLMIKDKWEYAMRVTNRTNQQIDLYEQLIAKILSNFTA